MANIESLILPADVQLVPITELPDDMRVQLGAAQGDFALVRPRSRSHTKLIDAGAARLLGEFRSQKTIVDAVIAYSRAQGLDPEKTLDEAYPLIAQCVAARLLAPAGSLTAERIEPALAPGEQVGDYCVESCIQVLEDTELHRARNRDGGQVALKIAHGPADPGVSAMLEREAAVLERLGGRAAPRLICSGEHQGRRYVAVEWCPGEPVLVAAQRLRADSGPGARSRMLALAVQLAQAYAWLHARGVLHGDVHGGNALVDEQGRVKLIDFGLARLPGNPTLGEPPRGGIALFFEPELAQQRRTPGQPAVPASAEGEQYALGVLLYMLFTGQPYCDFSADPDQMMRQIAESPPLPFTTRGIPAWPDVEACLARALAKNPAERHASMAAFAEALDQLAQRHESSRERAAAPGAAAHEQRANLVREVMARLAPDGPLFTSGIAAAPTCSINNGMAGIAYAVHRMACVRGDPALLSLADLWITRASRDSARPEAFFCQELDITPASVGPIALYHTETGVHCVRALIANGMGDVSTYLESIQRFVAAAQIPCENPDLTLGRAGLLIACSALLDARPDDPHVDIGGVHQLGKEIMAGIWQQLDVLPAIGECAGRLDYLGIAHGWAGIIHATLRLCGSAGWALPDALTRRLDELARCAEPTGRGVRWKIRVASPGHSYTRLYMPSWCNGSAGMVHLWTLAYRYVHEERYAMLAEGAACNAWDEAGGLPSLCCGLGGQAYAMASMYRQSGEPIWLERAHQLAESAAALVRASDSMRDSLYNGALGVAVLAVDLERPEGACMPLFEPEGWPPCAPPGQAA